MAIVADYLQPWKKCLLSAAPSSARDGQVRVLPPLLGNLPALPTAGGDDAEERGFTPLSARPGSTGAATASRRKPVVASIAEKGTQGRPGNSLPGWLRRELSKTDLPFKRAMQAMADEDPWKQHGSTATLLSLATTASSQPQVPVPPGVDMPRQLAKKVGRRHLKFLERQSNLEACKYFELPQRRRMLRRERDREAEKLGDDVGKSIAARRGKEKEQNQENERRMASRGAGASRQGTRLLELRATSFGSSADLGSVVATPSSPKRAGSKDEDKMEATEPTMRYRGTIATLPSDKATRMKKLAAKRREQSKVMRGDSEKGQRSQEEREFLQQCFEIYDIDGITPAEAWEALLDAGLQPISVTERRAVAELIKEETKTKKGDDAEAERQSHDVELDLEDFVNLVGRVREALGSFRTGALESEFEGNAVKSEAYAHDQINKMLESQGMMDPLSAEEACVVKYAFDYLATWGSPSTECPVLPSHTLSFIKAAVQGVEDPLEFHNFEKLFHHVLEHLQADRRKRTRDIAERLGLEHSQLQECRRDLVSFHEAFQRLDSRRGGHLLQTEVAQFLDTFGLASQRGPKLADLIRDVKRPKAAQRSVLVTSQAGAGDKATTASKDALEVSLECNFYILLQLFLRIRGIERAAGEDKLRPIFAAHDGKQGHGSIKVEEIGAALRSAGCLPKTRQEQMEIGIILSSLGDNSMLTFFEFQRIVQCISERLRRVAYREQRALALEQCGMSEKVFGEVRDEFLEKASLCNNSGMSTADVRQMLEVRGCKVSTERLADLYADFSEYLDNGDLAVSLPGMLRLLHSLGLQEGGGGSRRLQYQASWDGVGNR
eukprot:TRINITY_DN39234_c0_g1_i1.p1 TRINITY_DN39234_c0_g1~~TRINITY_DN39234_c0_g1_i1.p1  ORF type:complete len:835 (+),score=230.78 TRINITY_DN39234_c0_g1_i1:123-2627(+)